MDRGELGTTMASRNETAELDKLAARITQLESELAQTKDAAASLALANQRTDAILDVAPDGIVTIDESGRIEFVNPAIVEIFGIEARDLIGKNVSVLMPTPFDVEHDGYLDHYRRTGERKILGRGREVMARHQDGTAFPIELSVSEVFEGPRRLFTGTIRDIRDRREAGMRLREDRDRLRQIFDSAVDGIIAIDETGKVLDANSSVERIFGFAPDEIIGQNVNVLMPQPFRDEHASYLERYLETGKKRIIGIGREVRGRRRDGESFPLYLAVSEGYIEHQRVFTAFIRDLEQLRDTEERARRAEQLAEVSTISAGIAHDVGTPMTTILGYAELLQKTAKDDKNRERAGHIVDQVRRVKDLLRTLLDIARPQSAQPVAISLIEVLDHSLGFFREKLKGRGIVVETDYSPVPKIVAERDRLEQVFLNLIVNAVDAMASGGTLTVHLARSTPELVEVCIADTGCGIDPAVLDHIFEPFYTTKERGKGTGLGLLVSQRIIHDHGGKITATSQPGAGTQILIRLPIEAEASQSPDD
jgi:PAS domain S-box-containing protein